MRSIFPEKKDLSFKQMIVVHYIPSIDRTSGGTGTYMQLIAKALGRFVDLHIVTHKERNPLLIENSTIHYISSSILLGMKREWISLLTDIHPDIVHCNCCWMPGSVYTQKWAQELGYKVILSPHGMLEPWVMKRHYWTKKIPALFLYQKSAIKNADYLHATAEEEKQNLIELGWNTAIAVIPNAVDVDNIPLKKDWRKRKKILFLSRIHVKKGIEFLIKAVAQLKEHLIGYEINIAGEGDINYINELKSLVRKLRVDNIIRFIGGVYGDSKWQMYCEADLFILPTYSENFGIVVAEALASGTPVITTEGTPWKELEIYHCGWYVKNGTEGIREALKQFLKCTDKELEVMGKNGRKLIEDKYSSSIVVRQFVHLYETIKNI